MANKKAGLHLADPSALIKDMYAMGPTIAKKGGQVGVRKAATELRKRLRAAAPKRTGTLRKVLQFKHSRRRATSWVGIKKRKGDPAALNYYATLERGRQGSAPFHPFIERTINNSKSDLFKIMVSEARKALYVEAGKVYARSKTRRKR